MDAKPTTGPKWSVWRVLVIIGLIGALVAVWTRSEGDGTGGGSAKPVAVLRSVEYRLRGDARAVDMTWTDGNGQTSQANGLALPLSDGLSFSAQTGSLMYLSAQNTGSDGYVTCEIVVDGEVVAQNTSSGGYAIVTCNTTV
jgi:hypothetical protein